MSHDPHLPRCPVCRKAVYGSYRDARVACVALMRQRKNARGYRPYWNRECRAWHLGKATDHQKRKGQAA